MRHLTAVWMLCVLAHGRLRDVELLGASREAERLGRSDKNPKPEIVHISPGPSPP